MRTKAPLLRSKGRDCREIESILVRSLEIAHHQQARCRELRTSCDLWWLWQSKGRNAEALKLLQSAHDQFTEGYESEDLRDAYAEAERRDVKVEGFEHELKETGGKLKG